MLIENHDIYIFVIAFLALLFTGSGIAVYFYLKNKKNVLESEKKHLQIIDKAEAMRVGKLAVVGELAAEMTHEINNPITGIINYAEILKDELDSKKKAKQILDGIINESERIAKIVKNFLYFSRDTGEGLTLLNLKDVFFESHSLIERQLSKEGVNLVVDIPDDLPVVEANRQQIQQVFVNIISNSRYALNMKYEAFDKKRKLEIAGKDFVEDGVRYSQISFYDTGIGISEKLQGKIFDPFFSLSTDGQGAGLGMSICHSIIKDHNGKLFLESEEGKFTRVIINLPAVDGEK